MNGASGKIASCGVALLIYPDVTNRAFSAAIRFNSSEAGSSFGSCGTSFPRRAKSRMKRAHAMNGFGRLNQSIEIIKKKVDTHHSTLTNSTNLVSRSPYSFFGRVQFDKQGFRGLAQSWQVVFGVVPNTFGDNARIAVDQQVADVDNLAYPRHAFGQFRVGFAQNVQCFAEDFEFPFDGRLCTKIARVGRLIHTFCEALDGLARLFDLREQDARIGVHR